MSASFSLAVSFALEPASLMNLWQSQHISMWSHGQALLFRGDSREFGALKHIKISILRDLLYNILYSLGLQT